jgi:DNA-binding response OmpR family regulator
MLTARDTEDDIIHGLNLGADDYLTKPFSFPELVARLQCITRAHRDKSTGTIEAGDVVIDLLRHAVIRNRQNVDLTRLEFQLLACLMRRAGRCVPRCALMEFIWGSGHIVGQGALDVLVNSLRTKFDAPFPERLIGTVRGAGYMFSHDAAEQRRRLQ